MNEKILMALGSDATVSDEYFDTLRRAEPIEPEKALLNALLGDAIHSYQKYWLATDRTGKERFREAEDWIMDSTDDWTFSFENVCTLLNLDPGYVRRSLRVWKKKSHESTPPSRTQNAA